VSAPPPSSARRISRIAVVNRGEAATRLLHAVREINLETGAALETVALLTPADEGSPASRAADRIAWLPAGAPGTAARAYLDVDSVMSAIAASGADAVWVGWGFLAESPDFARRVRDACLVFIGPPPEAMALAGDKVAAKALAESAGVPVVPWSGEPLADLGAATEHAERIGYPVLLKAAAGGGGRGIRRVDAPGELARAFDASRREAALAFSDPRVFVEACVTRARHLEVQIAADDHGAIQAYGVRDCTVQRRHQKVIEEAPGPWTTPELAERLCGHAVAFARAAGYRNLGTVEFIQDLDRGAAFFMEMNARLQVEHPVTELVHGVDLVKLQLALAQGGHAPPPPPPRGYAIEARLTAEDCDQGDAPAPGRVLRFRYPRGPGLRVDSGVAEGVIIPPDFDSMIAKVIAHGRDRAEAIARLRGALEDMAVLIEDGATNKALLLNILSHPDFRVGRFDTGWLDRARADRDLSRLDSTAEALLAAAILSYRAEWASAQASFFAALERGLAQRLPPAEGRTYRLSVRDQRYDLSVHQLASDRFRLRFAGAVTDVGFVDLGDGLARLLLDDVRLDVLYHLGERTAYIEVDGVGVRIARDAGGVLHAPAPAMIVSLDVAIGDAVEAGDALVTVESMKMEMVLPAPTSGRVSAIFVQPRASVGQGDAILAIEAAADADAGALDEMERVTPPATADPLSALFDPEGMPRADDLRAADRGRLRAIRGALVSEARTALFGYDLDFRRAQRLARLLAATGLWDAPLFADESGPFVDLLCDFAAVEWALSRRELRGDAERAPASMHAAFFQFASASRGGEGACRIDYRRPLLRALRAHGLDSLAPSCALDEALTRMAIAHGDVGPRVGLRFSLASSLVQLVAALHEAGALAATGGAPRLRALERALLQLRGLDGAAWLTLADRAAQAHHQLFHKPRFEARASEVQSLVDAALAGLPGEVLDELVAAPASATGPLARAACERDGPAGELAARAFVARLYHPVRELSTAPPGAGGVGAPRLITAEVDGHSVAVAFARADALEPAVAAVAALASRRPALEGLDVVVWDGDQGDAFDDLVARFEAAVGARRWGGEPRRITLAVATPAYSLRAATLPLGQALAQDPRDLHPVTASHLALWRFSAFDLERLPSHDGIYAYRAVARTNREDARAIVLCETRDVYTGTVLDDAPAALFTFEHGLREAVRTLREVQSQRDARGRYHWNQIHLVARPAVEVRRDGIIDHIRVMPVDFRALGLERFVMRGRLSDPDRPGSPPELTEIAVTSPAGRQLEVHFEPASSRRIAPATPYELKVQRARRRGLDYPYEVIRMLTSPETHEVVADRLLPPGEFVEYDLVDRRPGETGPERAAPVERPPGDNRAAVVFGLVRHRTEKHPEGMERVLILADPLRDLGALGEAECRRLLAALDLAWSRGIPVEWVPISSGARIAMDSGTENLDWTARVLRRIIELTRDGHPIHVIVDGVNVGAQSYFDAEATMLMHTRGVLIMTRRGAIVLTGKRALDFSGSVSASDERGIGGFERVMGPNGQAQYYAEDLAGAFEVLFAHYRYTYIAPGERAVRPFTSRDPVDRDVTASPYPGDAFASIGEIFSAATNRERKRPFEMRAVMAAVIDADGGHLERWRGFYDAETAIVWDAHLGGEAVTVIGVESRPLPRHGTPPSDGPDTWAAGTLFPRSSKKVARALNAASGNRPAVILANLSGFDGSPESMRELQLELGAEIGRAVVGFEGPILFYVVGRYHGGAYVVFSRALNPGLVAVALEGSYASVIGGAPAAAVVFPAVVRERTLADPRVVAARAALEAAPAAERRRLRDAYEAVWEAVRADMLRAVADEFDAMHTVERARAVGSLEAVIPARDLRPHLIDALRRARTPPSGG